jgi:DNA-binding MarR family transcriptional regulator
MMQTKLEILKAKIEKIIESTYEAKKEFLSIIACHNGSVMPDSVPASFEQFKEIYSNESFDKVKNELIEEGIIFIPKSSYQPLQFSVRNEKGDYDSQSGEEISKHFGKLVFEHKPKIRETIEELVREPESKEFLRYIATQRGIHIYDGIEPEIKEIIGRQSYERILKQLLEIGILNKYAWSSRKHGYTGYKLLPYVDEYIKSKLGIFELDELEKTVLAYIRCMGKIFSEPVTWHVWFNYPREHEHKVLSLCSLAQKFLACFTYRKEEEIKNTVEKLKSKGLVYQVDLGYTKGGFHRGIILQLSKAGEEIAAQKEKELIEKVENKIKEIFSEKENRIVHYLFCNEGIPLKILALVKRSNVNGLMEAGLIDNKESLFLQFNQKISFHDYIHSGFNSDEVKKWLKEQCETFLTKEEKSLVGFLSGCKNIVVGKYPDWNSWNLVTSRTQRNYQAAYEALLINFPYLKKLFSRLTNISIEEVDKMILRLEENGFLVQEKNSAFGFPGYVLIYKIPVKFDFELDTPFIRSKVNEYIQFLANNLDKSYNQLIFLDYLCQFCENYQYDFMVDSSSIKEQLLKLLNCIPPAEYSPIYAFEDKMILVYPAIKEELKKEIYKLKGKLVENLRNIIQELTKEYQNNIAYNYVEKSMKEGYFILEIESPDPSVGTVSFVITPWITPLSFQEITSLCVQSNTVNLFVFYPDYPQLKSVITGDGRYNLIIIRNKNAHLFLRNVDQLTQTILTKLADHFKIKKEGERVKREIEELEEKFPNLRKVRFIIPEVEELLRNTVRPPLIKEFGEKWQEIARQRFPKAEDKKQKWQKEHPTEQIDILQGISIGEFVTLFEDKTFSFLKNCFKDFELARASINKFLKRKEYHHGKPKDGKDIPNEEIDILNTAYRTLKEMVKP